ncbi:OmpH family outer membrane protein [Natroniella sulfidigena]|uniref:OmpH family outer membrane protein n=1 Tax=Natroniella sulfidigena TaxID=723921 RepID=UPI00200B1972|nr:OmpH family outer membrane protein [Natroniella sulfidigena]MCK8816375.1 OmpH family outer membrane protein [Natroniella sulfidigena]
MKKLLASGLLITLVIVGALVAVNPVQAEQAEQEEVDNPQIAYVDMESLFLKHPHKEASEEELDQKAEQLQQQLEAEAVGLTKEERQELLKEYQQKLNQLEKDLIQSLIDDINYKIREVAQREDITIIIDQPVVIYGGYDLTAEVLAELDTEEVIESESDESEEEPIIDLDDEKLLEEELFESDEELD